MVEKELPTELGLAPCSGLWSDACAMTVALLTKSSRANNCNVPLYNCNVDSTFCLDHLHRLVNAKHSGG